ncbi:tyrosine-protein phosphatase 99A isoform X2 [Drosophila willistoni]|nr:tyrosine-protein phosphatase 99A isoform X2 [Drosophila willistoni]
MPRYFFHCQLLLFVLMQFVQSLPVSNPEISNKVTNSVNSIQVQQQPQTSSGSQDLHLNTLSAFASSYDQAQQLQQQQQQQQSLPIESGFKPSYKMPEMETNFTPMQTAGTPSVASLPSTPMLMQYLPAQTLQDGSGAVQYLQLIPTRPIIVPISPYLAAAAASANNGNAAPSSPPAAPSLTPHANAQPDYSGRNAAVLSVSPSINSGIGLHYGSLHHGYAGSISPAAAYRNSYRINREAKDKHFPPAFTLNLNEYIPSATLLGGSSVGGLGGASHDVTAASSASHPHTHMYIRARTT